MLCAKDCLQSLPNDRQQSSVLQISKGTCVGCRLCLTECPVVHFSKNQVLSLNTIMQAGDCINCGLCLERCPAGAIQYEDDTARFMQDVSTGVTMSLLLAPAVINGFTDYRQLLGYLKTLGVKSFHNVLLRADITMWAYVELMRRDPEAAFISSPCAAVSAYIRSHMPDLQRFLMPVYSPLVCTIVYLKKYQRNNNRLAFLSPCIAKGAEIKTANPLGYNITIDRLQQYIATKGINLADYEPVDFDDQPEGNGQTLGTYGGVSECIAAHLPDRTFIKISGPAKVYNWLAKYEQSVRTGQKLPSLVEIYNCRAGCEGGTGINAGQKTGLESIDVKAFSKDRTDSVQNRQAAELLFKNFSGNLCLSDFVHGSGECPGIRD